MKTEIKLGPAPHAMKRMSLSIREASEATTLSERMIYYLISQGRLRVTKIGRRTLIPVNELEKLVNRGA
jgi:excisionase family DNA binding protein